MPRAKKKTVGTGRGRKKIAAANMAAMENGSGAVMPAMDADAATECSSENAAVSTTPSVAQELPSPALILPDCLDSAAAISIKEMLLSQRGNAIVVDASQVRRVGVQSLQVLVAAARSWERDGLSYCLKNASSEFLETMALVGLPHQDLLLEGHQ